jgi:hypothetical protein
MVPKNMMIQGRGGEGEAIQVQEGGKEKDPGQGVGVVDQFPQHSISSWPQQIVLYCLVLKLPRVPAGSCQPNPILQGMVKCLTSISNQMLRMKVSSGKNGGWQELSCV